jgi:chaperonin cofactor prefoldin
VAVGSTWAFGEKLDARIDRGLAPVTVRAESLEKRMERLEDRIEDLTPAVAALTAEVASLRVELQKKP